MAVMTYGIRTMKLLEVKYAPGMLVPTIRPGKLSLVTNAAESFGSNLPVGTSAYEHLRGCPSITDLRLAIVI